MHDTPKTLSLGTPIAVDVGLIEQELSSLWKSASGNEGEKATIRACSCNLVVIACNRHECEALPEILARVAEWHPCRSLIAYPEEIDEETASSGAAPMRAWINAQCSVPVAGGPQVCCEAITIAARRSSRANLPNTLISVFVPDLPVFLYWRSFNLADEELAERIAHFSDLLIVDSHVSKEQPANRERLLELLTDPPHQVAVRDLNWSRLTAWRDLIAQFFDAPSSRRYAREISEIEIVRAVASPGNIPTRTLLLTGWLASRLGWKRVSAERHDDEWRSRWKSATGDVLVRFTGNPKQAGQPPGISSITIRTGSGPTFVVRSEKGSPYITATSEAPGSVLVHSVLQEDLDEATLLVRELSLAGEDAGFRHALAEALALERSFR